MAATTRCNERTHLLLLASTRGRHDDDGFRLRLLPGRQRSAIILLLCLSASAAVAFLFHTQRDNLNLLFGISIRARARADRYPSRLGKSKLAKNEQDHLQDPLFQPTRRCDWVEAKLDEKNAGKSEKELRSTYATQATDYNVFYRATAHIFWNDFVANNWANKTLTSLSLPYDALNPKSMHTWVTGDQHLSNFGAWRNRNNEVVFSVNDFDEAAIYDFHIDVLRIAVSITNHAITNGLSERHVDRALLAFLKGYVQTVLNYVGNEDALLFELTSSTAYGPLKTFLKEVEQKTAKEQLKKFTTVDDSGDDNDNVRHFIKGPVDVPDEDTNLATVPDDVQEEIRAAFSPTHYGATMMKLGWHVKQWDVDYFRVLDVAERIGSGVGSLGVDRYYVLLKGTDGLLGSNGNDGTAVILDVKEQPLAAVERVLSANDAAWYNTMFPNAAARVVEAQRHLTSYVDPFTGWLLLLDKDSGLPVPFNVRQRSPWKDSMDLEKLTDVDDFCDFVAQIAIATATSHVRGTVSKAPAQFKDVIYLVFNENRSNWKKWSRNVSMLAKAYHIQVMLDYQCFQSYVQDMFGKSN